MFFHRRADSRELSGAAVVLKSERGYAGAWWWLLLLIAGVIATAGFGAWYVDRYFVPLDRFERLADEKKGVEQENNDLQQEKIRLEQANQTLHETILNGDDVAQTLRQELERAELDLEIGAVTQMELERQIVVLNEQLKQVREELEFMKTAGGEKR